MSDILADAITGQQLADEMGVSYQTAVNIAKAADAGVKVGNKTVFYSRSRIRVHLFAKYEHVLKFLGAVGGE